MASLERICASRFLDSFFGRLASSSSSPLPIAAAFSERIISIWHGDDMYGLVRPWAR